MMPADAGAALCLFAAAPLGQALVLQGPAGPVCDSILAALAQAEHLPPSRRLPLHISVERLTGGIDLSASIAAGRPVAQSGLLDGGPRIFVLPMAERWQSARLAPLLAALDAHRHALVLLDQSAGPDETLAASLAERCALRIDLATLPDDFRPTGFLLPPTLMLPDAVPADLPDDLARALCLAADALGVAGLRPILMAASCARVAAGCAGRDQVAPDDAGLAARLVLAPRATRLPDPSPPPDPSPDLPEPDRADPPDQDSAAADAAQAADILLDAVRATLPPHLLDGATPGRASNVRSAGRHGQHRAAAATGRPSGSRDGLPRDGLRLDLIGTLRRAAPWQKLRGRQPPEDRLKLRATDLRVIRRLPRAATTTIFAVDASGSLAASRLAEVKGAIELLLAECYVRRDSIALLAFRGAQAQLLLPPTRAPARARRCLAGLAGGGGTPLALGIEAAHAQADAARRRGQTPTIVLLTDGAANIGRGGAPGRQQAAQDALSAATALGAAGHRTLLIDAATRRQPQAEALASAMRGRYLPLPRADARAMHAALRHA